MKLLVLTTDPVGADDVRSALPDADLDGSEVLVVSPAVNESPVAFWVSDSDEAIEEAESAAEQTAAALREGGARVRAKTGESEPLVALQDALATYPARSGARLRARGGRRALPRGRRARRGAAALRRAGHRDRSLTVRRRVSCASWRGRQFSRRRALPASMITGRRSASTHEASSGRKGRWAIELGRRLDGHLRHRHGPIADGGGEVAHRDLARGREVVGAGLAAPDDAGAQRGGDIVVMDELEGDARVREDADGAGQRGQRTGQAIGPARLGDRARARRGRRRCRDGRPTPRSRRRSARRRGPPRPRPCERSRGGARGRARARPR